MDIAKLLEHNTTLRKFGMTFRSNGPRLLVDRYLMRNNDIGRHGHVSHGGGGGGGGGGGRGVAILPVCHFLCHCNADTQVGCGAEGGGDGDVEGEKDDLCFLPMQ